MDPILEAARKYDLVIIEDATESLGATYQGRMVGTLGDIGCFSFNGNKIITTGGGGMIVTDDETWAEKARYLTTQAKDDPVEYVHDEIGYNYRLTNLQAAMGVAQLEQLTEYIAAKREIAEFYSGALDDVPGLEVYQAADWAGCIYWMSSVLVDEDAFGMGSRELLAFLAERGIQTRPLWQPMSALPLWEGCQSVGGETALWLNERALSLPCSVGVSEAELERVVRAVREAHGAGGMP
jgi:dTDP-4-amino-4,6-dideoxygalactose transaminase